MTYMREVNKNLEKLQTKGKALFLQQNDFYKKVMNKTIDPDFALNIAEKSEVDGIICSKGVVEKYGQSYKTNFIVRTNGDIINSLNNKSNNLYSPISCSIKVAVELDAKAISFTNFIGSSFQSQIVNDFRQIQEEAHDFGLPVLSSMKIPNLNHDDLFKVARDSLSIGADILAMPYNGNPTDLNHQIQGTGRAKLYVENENDLSSSKDMLKQIKEINDLGVNGYMLNGAILGHENPFAMIKSIRDIQIRKKDIYAALTRLEK